MQLRPYQLYGALWLAQSPRAMLGDPPGLGKTPQAIKACELVGAVRIVVICPAVAVSNWLREWRQWWSGSADVTPSIYSYDKIGRDKKLRQHLMECQLDVLVLDEAHYLKTVDSLRTKHIYSPKSPERGIASSATYCWALSGTFSPNHVGEYWTHIRTLAPHLFDGGTRSCLSYVGFLKHFTNWHAGEFGIQVLGVRKDRRQELQAILNKVGLRREIADVLPDLPPISWGTVTTPAGEAAEELCRLEETPEVIALVNHFMESGEFTAHDVHLATLRRLIGRVKVAGVANLIKEELSAGHYRKIVLWAWHKEVVQYLCGALGSWGLVMIDGSVSNSQRGQRVEQFQQNPDIRVFIGQIQAAGTAITLTAANQVVFVESSWVPDENEQAAKRCHRYGQQQPVFVRIAALDQSIDQIVAATINRKLQNKIQIGEN